MPHTESLGTIRFIVYNNVICVLFFSSNKIKYPLAVSYESEDEDSDDESQDAEYDLSSSSSGPAGKKVINKGRWTKDEVRLCTLCLRLH